MKKRKGIGESGLRGALSVVLLLVGLSGCKQEQGVARPGSGDSGKVRVEFYVTPKCPYGVSIENAIAPVLKRMSQYIDFSLDLIGTVEGDILQSAQGDSEVVAGKIQTCAMELASDSYMDLVVCMNKSWQQMPQGWVECAQEAGLPVDKLQSCIDGRRGYDLLKASYERSTTRGIRGSPAVFINNSFLRGARNQETFARSICSAMGDSKPEMCNSLPPPVKLPVVVINDDQCTECNIEMIHRQMQKFFDVVDFRVMDVKSEEGRKLYQDLKLGKLPVVLFDEKIKEQYAYARFEQVVVPRGNYLITNRWAVYDPGREICDNQKDDNGDKKVDCADAHCRHALVCRKEAPKKLEVFVMSQCPYGVRALESMQEVLKNFNNNLDFEVHYIATEEPDGTFSALHGQPEVNENIRGLCAAKHHPKQYKFMDYIWCRNKNIHSVDWMACTGKATGIKPGLVEKCVTGRQGKNLLSEDIKIAEGMNISASPTWVVNNKHTFSGLDPETIKTNFCKHNPGLKGCENTLSGKSDNAVGGTCN